MTSKYSYPPEYSVGDQFWFDCEGIGAETPLSYFGWDFDECAKIENIEGNQITIAIRVANQDDVIYITSSKEVFERMIQRPTNRNVEWLEESIK